MKVFPVASYLEANRIGNVVQALRQRKGMSRVELAKKVKVSQRVISSIEANGGNIPFDKILLFMGALEIKKKEDQERFKQLVSQKDLGI